jgi:alpha-amylase
MQVISTMLKRQLLWLTLVVSSGVFSSAAVADAILHAFDWHYDEVAAKATEIKNLGYKAVLVAPRVTAPGGSVISRRISA